LSSRINDLCVPPPHELRRFIEGVFPEGKQASSAKVTLEVTPTLAAMQTVPTYLWRIPATPHRRAYTSTIHRTPEDALAEYGPKATIVEGSMKLQTILEEGDQRAMQSAGRDGAKHG
jgi:hypothetical protein